MNFSWFLFLLFFVFSVAIAQREVAQMLNNRLGQVIKTRNKSLLRNLFENDFQYNICRGPFLSLDQYLEKMTSYQPPVQFSYHLVDAKIKFKKVLEMRTFYKINGASMTVVYNVKLSGDKIKISSGFQEC